MVSAMKVVGGYMMTLFAVLGAAIAMVIVAVMVDLVLPESIFVYVTLFLFNATYTLFILMIGFPAGVVIILLGLIVDIVTAVVIPVGLWMMNFAAGVVLGIFGITVPTMSFTQAQNIIITSSFNIFTMGYTVTATPTPMWFSTIIVPSLITQLIALLNAFKGWLMTYAGFGLGTTYDIQGAVVKTVTSIKMLMNK